MRPAPDELIALRATLAGREAFTRYGIDRPPFLSTLTFKVGKGKDGRDVLLVRSTDAIPEPFVTFLVEVNWARGRLMREYTVLLDPPVYTPGEAASSAGPGCCADRSRADAPDRARIRLRPRRAGQSRRPASRIVGSASSAPQRRAPRRHAPAARLQLSRRPGRHADQNRAQLAGRLARARRSNHDGRCIARIPMRLAAISISCAAGRYCACRAPMKSPL